MRSMLTANRIPSGAVDIQLQDASRATVTQPHRDRLAPAVEVNRVGGYEAIQEARLRRGAVVCARHVKLGIASPRPVSAVRHAVGLRPRLVHQQRALQRRVRLAEMLLSAADAAPGLEDAADTRAGALEVLGDQSGLGAVAPLGDMPCSAQPAAAARVRGHDRAVPPHGAVVADVIALGVILARRAGLAVSGASSAVAEDEPGAKPIRLRLAEAIIA